mmetsp:Transcript_52394/g.131695  ORF Transcript_52394/g.131695 Transcript_52394/m.131695 type:complete len:214 (-) Transcript_52394:683-1324(-)
MTNRPLFVLREWWLEVDGSPLAALQHPDGNGAHHTPAAILKALARRHLTVHATTRRTGRPQRHTTHSPVAVDVWFDGVESLLDEWCESTDGQAAGHVVGQEAALDALAAARDLVQVTHPPIQVLTTPLDSVSESGCIRVVSAAWCEWLLGQVVVIDGAVPLVGLEHQISQARVEPRRMLCGEGLLVERGAGAPPPHPDLVQHSFLYVSEAIDP